LDFILKNEPENVVDQAIFLSKTFETYYFIPVLLAFYLTF